MNERGVYVELGSVAELKTGYPFKSANYSKNVEDPRLVRGDNVVQGETRWDNAKRWPKDQTQGLESYWLRENDVVLAMDRPWIEAGLKRTTIRRADLPALLVQRVARLRGSDMLDAGFLGYVTASRDFTNYILAVQTGTAVPHISAEQIKGFKFRLPPLEEQRAIAHILGTLDDKIELNRRMNETLEEMARALFKSWFVDFDPVRAKMEGRQPFGMDDETAALFPDSFEDSALGEIPEGWSITSIGEAVKVMGGGTPSTKEPSFWDGGTHCWATPKDLSKLQSPVLLDTERKVTDAGLAKISSGLLPMGTVLLSSRAPIGYLAVAQVPVAVNQGFIAMLCDGPLTTHYVLHWARINVEQIKGRAGGTTFPEISKKNFRSISVLMPFDEVLSAFEKQVVPLYDKMSANLRQSATLAAIRDALLPKLLSGEVRVREAEEIVEGAL